MAQTSPGSPPVSSPSNQTIPGADGEDEATKGDGTQTEPRSLPTDHQVHITTGHGTSALLDAEVEDVSLTILLPRPAEPSAKASWSLEFDVPEGKTDEPGGSMTMDNPMVELDSSGSGVMVPEAAAAVETDEEDGEASSNKGSSLSGSPETIGADPADLESDVVMPAVFEDERHLHWTVAGYGPIYGKRVIGAVEATVDGVSTGDATDSHRGADLGDSIPEMDISEMRHGELPFNNFADGSTGDGGTVNGPIPVGDVDATMQEEIVRLECTVAEKTRELKRSIASVSEYREMVLAMGEDYQDLEKKV